MGEDVRARGNPFGPLPARYIFTIHASVGMGIVYGLKVCMSVAMVGMVNNTAVEMLSVGGHSDDTPKVVDECGGGNDTSTASEDGPFLWDSDKQGYMLSAYFWGYIVAQLPGGKIAEKFSAKWVMFFSVVINVICTVLTPPLAEISWILVILMRVGEGIGGGVTFPACHVMLSKWAPPNERSLMSAITYAGTSLGTVISLLGAGVLAKNFGWESIFYVFGGLSAIWLVFWTILIYDSPNLQPFMRQSERDYILEALGSGKSETEGGKKKTYPTPWKSIFTSMPFWAIFVAHCCSNWGWYMVLIEMPFYMKQVLKFKLSENAIRVALPFLTLWLFSMGLSKTLDKLKANNKITTTTARKTATLIASVIPLLCLLGICFSGCDRGIAVALVAIATTALGAMFCGFLANHIDLAPNHAGILMAITNTAATIPGIIVPLFVGHLTHSNPTIASWRIIFGVTIVLFTIEAIFYSIFGSGEEQSWNKPKEDEEEMNKKGEAQPLRG